MNLRIFNLKEIEPAVWQNVFTFCLQGADSFILRFIFKEETEAIFHQFFALPKIEISAWVGVEDGIQISGQLTEEIKNIIYNLQEPAFSGKNSNLENFKFLQQNREILAIENFHERLIHLTEGEITLLEKTGIDTGDWEEVALAVVEGYSSPVDWSDEELRTVAGLISHWLSSDKKH